VFRAIHEAEKEKLKTTLKNIYYNIERRKNTENTGIIK
jgi:hypothetical protein